MQNKRRFLVTSILAFLFTTGLATTQAKRCLWKVSSESGILYLQGSVHVLKAENYPLDPAIEAAYSNSTALALEVDMAEMLSPKTQQLIMGKAMLEQPESLKTILKPLTYKNLETACADAGMPIAAIQQFKPWFATMTLAILKMQKSGLNPEHGVDKYFYEKAVVDQKPVIGFETVDFQINLFDSLANMNPNDFVDRSLLDLKLMDQSIEKLLSAWQNGDIVTLDTLMSESFFDYPDLYQKFIVARNKNWSDKITELLKNEGTTMVVVGAGHFGGEQGLLKLLEKKGYKLEQQ